jgi:hypothetical protein
MNQKLVVYETVVAKLMDAAFAPNTSASATSTNLPRLHNLTDY